MMLSSKILSELCVLMVSRFLYNNKMHSFYFYQFALHLCGAQSEED